MTDIDGLDSFEDQIIGLEQAIRGADTGTATFSGNLERMQNSLNDTGRGLDQVSSGFSRNLRKAIDGLIFDGAKLSDTLTGLAQSMVNTAYSAAIRPVSDHLSGAFSSGVEALIGGILPFEKGGAFSQGRVMPFAHGGVISGATQFPMRGGVGLMGEAGPEAIMPLRRGSDGRLGVEMSGGGPVSVVMNIQTPDAEGFRRSQAQIAAQVSRALGRGQRNR